MENIELSLWKFTRNSPTTTLNKGKQSILNLTNQQMMFQLVNLILIKSLNY